MLKSSSPDVYIRLLIMSKMLRPKKHVIHTFFVLFSIPKLLIRYAMSFAGTKNEHPRFKCWVMYLY